MGRMLVWRFQTSTFSTTEKRIARLFAHHRSLRRRLAAVPCLAIVLPHLVLSLLLSPTMKFTLAFSLLACDVTLGFAPSSNKAAFAKRTSSSLSSAVASDVYTFAKSEEIFAEAKEVRSEIEMKL